MLEASNGGWRLVDTSATRRLILGNHEDATDLQAFRDAFDAFVNSHGVTHVVVRRATYKGQKRSGAAAIKMEALLQLGGYSLTLVPSQTIAKHFAAQGVTPPASLTGYQADAFATALYAFRT